jgi:hypothetical protein
VRLFCNQARVLAAVSKGVMSNPISAKTAKALWILVPKSGCNIRPTEGSGIVGSGSEDRAGLIRIDFEGNLYGATNLTSFWERLFHTAGRHVTGYPTVAREYHCDGPGFPYIRVGLFDYEEAVARVRSRELSVEQAMKLACEIDLTLKDLFENWAGQLF